MAADRHQSSVRLLFLVWTCVTNLLSSTDGHFIPEFERPASNFTVTLGQQAILTCHVIHLGGYKVGWIKSDTKAIQAIHLTVVTHNHRVAVRHYGSSSWQLILNDVKREDEGEYMCQINTNPMKSQIFFLRVVVPPEIDFSETTNEVMIAEGSSLKLGCKAKGVPIPVVRWHREDGEDITIRTPLGERHRYSTYEGDTLKLNKVSRLDMGVYVCTASNGVLPAASRRIMVSIHFNPVVHVPNQLIWSTVGSNLTMECFVEASPRSMNFWVKGEGELILSSKKYTLSDVRDSIFAVRMSLTVHSFEKEDVGKYRCVAKNSLGEVEGRIHVYESKPYNNAPSSHWKKANLEEIEYKDDEDSTTENESVNITMGAGNSDETQFPNAATASPQNSFSNSASCLQFLSSSSMFTSLVFLVFSIMFIV